VKTALLTGVSALFLATGMAHAAERLGMWLPPPQYDVPYTGELTIVRVATEQDIRTLCPEMNFGEFPATSCTMTPHNDRTRCYIFIASDKALKAAHNMDYVTVLRHEIGHCNGWPADHKDGRPSSIDHRSTMPTLPASTKYLPAYPPVICVTPEWKPVSCVKRKLDAPETTVQGPTLPW
jgi:hypothetical protein